MGTENTEEVKVDRRVVKTKRAIRNAFAQLLSEKSIDEITIKDIAETADVNRKTVYNYYGGIYDILDEIENDVVSSFDKISKGLDFKRNIENPHKIFQMLTSVINSDLEFYSRLMKMDANSHLVRKFVNVLKVRIRQTLDERVPNEKDKTELISDYITSGMLAAYQAWFNSSRARSLEDYSKDVSVLVMSGINGLLGTH